MRTRLPLFLLLLLAGPAVTEFASATPQDQDHDATMALAEPGPAARPPRDATRAFESEAAVRRIVSIYRRAIETQDVTLFRTVMPDIGSDAAERLRRSFKTIGSQQVDMTIDSVDVEGDTATVRVSRQDTIDGRQMKRIPQNFHLVRSGSAWWIQSLSVGR